MPVASLAEAWIEIAKACFVLHGQRGRLPRGGVDWNAYYSQNIHFQLVASLAEAWIEIIPWDKTLSNVGVASLAEAWIEMKKMIICGERSTSPPSRRRGLKFDPPKGLLKLLRCRLPRGGVDWNNSTFLSNGLLSGSPPSRRRGLKWPRHIHRKSS